MSNPLISMRDEIVDPWGPPDVAGVRPSTPIIDVSISGRNRYPIPFNQPLVANQSNYVPLNGTVRQTLIQNNSGATIYRSYDKDANLGSYAIGPGQTQIDTVESDSLYLYVTAGGIYVNGFTTGGIVIETYT